MKYIDEAKKACGTHESIEGSKTSNPAPKVATEFGNGNTKVATEFSNFPRESAPGEGFEPLGYG